MAVERYGETKETLKPLTGERLQAADFGSGGEAVGRAVQGFGQQLGKVAEVYEERVAKFDEAAVRRADAEDAMKLLEIKQRALSAKGLEAHGAIETANKEIEELARTRQASFSSSRQRDMYADVFGRRSLSVRENLGEHSIQQTELADKAETKASIDANTEWATANFDNPDEFGKTIRTLNADIDKMYKGMPASVTARAKYLAKSNIHASVFERLASDPDKIADAAMYIRDNAAEIDEETETKLYKMINPLIKEERTSSDVARAFGGAPADTGGDVDDGDDAPDPLAPVEPNTEPAPYEGKGFVSPLGPKYKRISSGFGRRGAPTKGASTDHGGIDIPAPEGTPIKPPMAGEVIASWFDAKHGGGHSVLIRHPNGMVTGYAHMRAASALQKGDQVERGTIIGGVGSTGRSTGPHLHYTVRNAAGGKVDPSAVSWAGGPTRDPKTVSWKTDKNAYAQYNAEDTDIVPALQNARRLAISEGWSTARYNDVVQGIRQQGNVNQANYADRNRRLEDDVWGTFAAAEEAGSPITSISALGPKFAQLDGKAKASVINMIQANKKALLSPEGEGDDAEDDSTFLDLLEASATDPKAFAKVDLRSIPMKKGDRRRLVGIQSKMLGTDGEPTNFAASHTRVLGTINRYVRDMGGDVGYTPGSKNDKRKAAVLFNAVTARASERQAELGRTLTDDEMVAIVRSQTVSMVRNGREMKRYVAERTPKKPGEVDAINIPADARAQIIRVYQRTHGGAMPTNRDVTARYLQWLSSNGG